MRYGYQRSHQKGCYILSEDPALNLVRLSGSNCGSRVVPEGRGGEAGVVGRYLKLDYYDIYIRLIK